MIIILINYYYYYCYYYYYYYYCYYNLVPRALFPGFGGGALSQRFGHPRVLGIPIPKSLAFWASPSHVTAAFWASPGTLRRCPNPQCFDHPLQKNAGFHGKIENVLEMASAKYRNLSQYLEKKAYPEGFTKPNIDSAKICQNVRV